MAKVSRSQAAELREAILVTTAGEFRRVGYEPTALMAVAERCGVTSSAIYNRFGGKAELARAIVEEHLEPALGPPLDARAARPWKGSQATGVTARASTPDAELMAVLHELQLAAAHDPDLRPTLAAFGGRRLDAALAARADADRRGRVRDGQDPYAQVMLHAAGAPGTYVLGLASPPPRSGWRSVGHLLRLATREMPLTTPAPAEPGASASSPDDLVPPVPPVTPDRSDGAGAGDPRVHDQLGQALMAAGARVIADQGYDRSTVASIARRAGVTTGALYNRFEGKADLLAEAVENLAAPRVEADVETVLAALDHGSEDADEHVSRVVEASLDRSDEAGRLRELLVQARHTARREPRVAAVLGHLQRRWVDLLAGGLLDRQESGAVRDDIDPTALAWWWLALPTGLSMVADAAPGPVEWHPTVVAVVRALRTAPVARR